MAAQAPMTEATYYILLALMKPGHGYGMMQRIKELSGGRIEMGPGTLYGVLTRMNKEGLITLTSEEGRRKNYAIAAVVVSVRVGADNGLVSGEVCFTKSLAQLLRPVNGQSVVCPVPWVKGNDIVVAFHIFPLLIFAVAEIGAHTGNGKIFLAAVQRGYSVILPEYEPPGFVKGGLHGKLVMLKG